MATVHKIGDPEGQSEVKAIRKLAEALPKDYIIVHNFELTTGRGLPYEYDMCVVGDFAVWHVEVKGYRGTIRGDQNQWVFENGGVMPSPIPLANKKTKILASKIKDFSARLSDVWVDTIILLTDDKAKVRLRDDQAGRVVLLPDAAEYLTNPKNVPVRTSSIEAHHNTICEALFGLKPSKKLKQIGLYDVIERINQTETRTVFLASHRYIRTRPKTILKVFHFDLYTSEDEKRKQIETIFHQQDALRLLGSHPNLIDSSDMFAWEDNKFVLPTEYIENGRPLEVALAREEDRRLSWKDKAEVVSKMARGLRHAHRNGVIHRDIRPLNVVVAPPAAPGGAQTVKLVNFDLALLRNVPHLNPLDVRDRLDRRYVAPEVWRDPTRATERSDIYSLGLVFYELITSQRAYDDIEEVIKAGAPTPIDRALLLSELSTPGSEDFMSSPQDAAGVIERMTKQDPTERHASMDEVLEDLSIIGDA